MGKISKEIELKVCNDYVEKELSSRQVAEIYKISKSTVLTILKRNNITPVNRRLVNNNLIIEYFKTIDSEEKVYFLGFIFADGCVSNNELFIDINEKDISILESFKKAINSKAKISTRLKGNSLMSRIAIKNAEFVDYLEQYGIVPNKTKITKQLPLNLIPKPFIKDFLRGLIDGDGWVIKTSQNYYKIGFVTQYLSTAEDFVYAINMLINNKFTCKIIEKKEGCFQVQFQKQEQVKEIAKILYENSSIHLNRKFLMAKEIYE